MHVFYCIVIICLWGLVQQSPVDDVLRGTLLLLVTAVTTQMPEWISLDGKSMKEAPSAPLVSEEQHPAIKKEHLT